MDSRKGIALGLCLGLACAGCAKAVQSEGSRASEGAAPWTGDDSGGGSGREEPIDDGVTGGEREVAAPPDEVAAAGRGGFAPASEADGVRALTLAGDAGAPEPPDTAPTPPAEPTTTGGCDFPVELLEVPEAGSGAFSGCPPRDCEGLPGDDRGSYDRLEIHPDVYAGCTRIVGDVVVQNAPVIDLSALSCLEHVTGDFVVWNSDQLVSLHGLESLAKVDGTLGIGHYGSLSMGNDAIASLEPLANVRALGELKLSSNDALDSLRGFSSLRAIAGSLWISFARDVTSLEGFEALQAVGGRIDLWRPEGIDDVSGFDGLESIGDGLLVWGATDLVDFEGFDAVRCIGGDIDVGGTAGWEQNAVLERFGGLSALEIVRGDIIIHHNLELRALDAFGALRSLGGDLRVHDNPLLPQCTVDALETRLREAGYAGDTQLTGNGPC